VVETKAALKATQRAWISPVAGALAVSLEKNKAIHFAIAFTNSGTEPALDVNTNIQSSTVDSYDPSFTDIHNVKVEPNTSCGGLSTQPGRITIPPLNNGMFGINFDRLHGKPEFLATDSIVNHSKFYVVNGCLVYNTYNSLTRLDFAIFWKTSQCPRRRETIR
jgi:hypothetical protein